MYRCSSSLANRKIVDHFHYINRAFWVLALLLVDISFIQAEENYYCQNGDDKLLAHYVDFLLDPDHKLKLEDILAQPANFEPIGKDYINFGTTNDQIWQQFTVTNCQEVSQDLIFVLNFVRANDLDIYKETKGTIEHIHDSGVNGATEKIVREFKTLAFRFYLEPGEKSRFIIRLIPSNESNLPFEIKETWQHGFDQADEQSLVMAISAAFLTLLAFNAILFFITQIKTFFLIVVVELTCLIFFLHIMGYTMTYLWGEGSWDMVATGVIGTFAVSITLLFTSQYYEMKSRMPRCEKIIRTFFYAGLLFVALKPLTFIYSDLPSTTVNLFGYAVIFPSLIAGVMIATYFTLSPQHTKPSERITSLFMLVAWIILAGNMFIIGLRPFDILPHTQFGNLYFGAALLLEAIFFTCALAFKVRVIYQDRETGLLAINAFQKEQLLQQNREKQLLLDKAIANQATSETGKLILAMGHDSRQIMAAIDNYAYVLTHSFTDPKVAKIGKAIGNATDVLIDVFASAIDFGDRNEKTQKLQLTEFSVERLFSPLSLIYKHVALENNVKLKFRQGDLIIKGDRVLLMRILGNTISNAIKATQDGFVYVAWRKRANHILLQVWDNGSGMSKEELHIGLNAPMLLNQEVDPYKDAHFGVGLKVSQELAKSLSSKLHVKSIKDKGTIVELTLPNETDR